MRKEDLDYADFKRKYKKKIAQEFGNEIEEIQPVRTSDYENFKKTFMPKNFSLYEKVCNFSEKIIPIKPDKEKIPQIEEAIRISHLNITPTGTVSFAAFVSILIIFASVIFGYLIPTTITGGETSSNFFFIFFGLMMAIILFFPLTKIPFIISNIWRMKSSNQMVLSVFYVVTYMRHTPNLELAVNFAADHLSPPLSLDFKKVLWDVETGKFDNINQSLDYYLDTWREYNPEFIESMHLIQSTLYESSESRRMDALDKGLSVILDETYEKMLHFTHDLQGPITTLHMLGIVLPILGLVILPLLTAFVPETKWYHLFAIYNILLPVLVYYLGKQILSTRPTGYGGVDLSNIAARSEKEKIDIKFNSSKYSVTPFFAAAFIGILLFIIGIIPLAIYVSNPDFDFMMGVNSDEGLVFSTKENLDSDTKVFVRFLDYRAVKDEAGDPTGKLIGPYGLIASLMSLFIPLSIGLALGFYYKWKTTNLEKVREETEKLEQEFASALFQLGNRLADGVPAEVAFSNVSKVMHGTKSGQFFDKISINIIKLGMGVEDAIFDKKVGAINDFPSSIIESSMKVFVESSKKGPIVASQAVISVAEYIKSMHRVDERLKDLMADTLSSMKSQVGFLTPIISGIVVGITSMIAQILGVLSEKIDEFGQASEGSINMGIMDMFGSGGVPTFYFQAIVGLYVVQITYILSVMINGIQNGSDKIGEMNTLGTNLVKSTLIYILVAGIFTVGFSIISISIVQNI